MRVHLFTILLASVLTAAVHAGAFRNTSNVPFASRCDGPMGALVVRDGTALTEGACLRAALTQPRQLQALSHAAATFRRLQRYGLVSPRARLALPRLVVHMRGNAPVLPDLAAALSSRRMAAQAAGRVTAAAAGLGDPANQLTFEYEGWSASDQAALQAYLAVAYPKARYIYGPPAFSNTVKIIRDDTITDIQGGLYDATTNEIRMPALTDNFPEDSFILMVLVLRAFHDDVALFYDSWEEGFVGAAANAVQVSPGISPGFDPKDPGPFYALSVYEAENHPELAGPSFYHDGDMSGMLVWRIAMARAAWMKVWIESNSFFSDFNQLYYAAFVEGLQGDVPALRELAATAVPTVEGIPFHEWFERQYVLDNSVHAGLKEYTWNIPLQAAVALICEHYITDDSGNEWVRGGQAITNYWSYNFAVSLYAEEGNVIDIPTYGDTPGEGFLIPTFYSIGGPQRITVQVDLNGLRSYYPYPYGVRGFEAGENNLYGGILGETTGTINVTGGNGISAKSASRGVWGGRITTGDLSPLKLTVTLTNPSGQDVTRQVNVGWDSYCVFLNGGYQTTLTRIFPVGVTGLQMMSLPVTPIQAGAADILGIPAADLMLARWDPSAPPDGQYKIWPSCEPFALGRAYWLRVLRDVTATITGVQAPDTDRIYVPLALGWNMFGPVRLNPVAVEELKIQVGTSAPVLLSEAVAKRYVQSGIFGYLESAGYDFVTELQPFGGYWIRALVPAGCQLVFEPVGLTSLPSEGRSGSRTGSASAAVAALPQPAWKLPLVVESSWLRSSAAYLGGVRGASAAVDPSYDLQAPPSFGVYVSLRFLGHDEAKRTQAYVTDVRGLQPRGEIWNLQVVGTLPDQPVTISWPDLSAVPADLRPVLVDPTADRRVYMRTTAAYTIPGAPEGVRRDLRIEMLGPEAATLVLSGLAASVARSTAILNYSLSRDAAVTARVMNIAGRPIRVLLQDSLQTSGANTVVWNLQDQRGTRVPSGRYLIELQARAADGQSNRALAPVNISR